MIVTRPIIPKSLNESFSGGENITDGGGGAVTERGIVWSKSMNPTISNNRIISGSGTESFFVTLTGLVTGTTYYVRAYATNSLNIAYGNEVSFVFSPPLYTCGANIAPGVWKQFMCHNLGSANGFVDPFTPSWEINGGYWQWGRKEMAARGPSGPGDKQANAGEIAGWIGVLAPNGSWSNDVKTNNDPCPTGFRVPTRSQWEGVINNNVVSNVGSSWTSSNTNYTTGKRFGDLLFLPAAGSRASGDGALPGRGATGIYWSSSEDGASRTWFLILPSDMAFTYWSSRTNGFSIRCIAE